MSDEKLKFCADVFVKVFEGLQRGLTYQEVSDITGVSVPYISRMVKGTRKPRGAPDMSQFARFAQAEPKSAEILELRAAGLSYRAIATATGLPWYSVRYIIQRET